ncbi:unnamed protein product [Owenia fusiformis]|uniref:Peptidase C1A papain C-terminal domain-containing protein n=1 Tax=Owenia fusiformis TaxID=6347 RepID=A0A8S4NE76_OWEFU|nr:unnamed protein product [Owenia fusiformis]
MSSLWIFTLLGCLLFISATQAQVSTNDCKVDGKVYRPGSIRKVYCQECICIEDIENDDHYVWECEGLDCLIRASIINHVNEGNKGWKAGSYSFLQDKSLTFGMKYKLGTLLPSSDAIPIRQSRVSADKTFPRKYDLRKESKGHVSKIRDQGDCASSWAISTTDVTSDRLKMKMTSGIKVDFSPQQLISCIGDKQLGCTGGHLDSAWEYMRLQGVADEECYPYTSGLYSSKKTCQVERSSSRSKNGVCSKKNKIYKMDKPYRMPNNEKEIMEEILTNGPVQATFVVHEDFFMYKSGIYRHSVAADDIGLSGYHSVRIVGWGSECSSQGDTKYWIVANSWGKQWGEQGYFRIQKGVNECEIESYVVGVTVRPSVVKRKLHSVVIEDLTVTSLGNIVAMGRSTTKIYNSSTFQMIKEINKGFLRVTKTTDGQLAFTTYPYSNKIHIYSEDGSPIRTITCAAPASKLKAIASLPAGWFIVTDIITKGVYMVDSANGNVTLISPSGMFSPRFSRPWNVAVGINSEIIVSDWGGNFIKVINRDGHEILHYGERGWEEGQLKGPWGVCTDSNGFIIVADSGNNRWGMKKASCSLSTTETKSSSLKVNRIINNNNISMDINNNYINNKQDNNNYTTVNNTTTITTTQIINTDHAKESKS